MNRERKWIACLFAIILISPNGDFFQWIFCLSFDRILEGIDSLSSTRFGSHRSGFFVSENEWDIWVLKGMTFRHLNWWWDFDDHKPWLLVGSGESWTLWQFVIKKEDFRCYKIKGKITMVAKLWSFLVRVSLNWIREMSFLIWNVPWYCHHDFLIFILMHWLLSIFPSNSFCVLRLFRQFPPFLHPMNHT